MNEADKLRSSAIEMKALHLTIERLELDLEELRATNEKLDLRVLDFTKTLNEIKKSEQRFRACFEQSNNTCMILDPNTSDGIPVVVEANENALETHGYNREDLVGRPITDVDDQEGKRMVLERTRQMLSKRPLNIENVHVRKDGTAFQNEVYATLIEVEGDPPLIFTTGHDISERKQREQELCESEERSRALVRNIATAVVVHAPDTSINMINDKALELLGITEDQALGRIAMDPNWIFLNVNKTSMSLDMYPVNQVIASGEALQNIELGINRPATGDVVWVIVSAVPMFKEGRINEVVVSFMDITERKQAEEQIRQLAMTDQLTGLANRRQFSQRMQQSIKLADREGKFLALMSLDLDKFKTVNDTYGHSVGDAVLRCVASILIKQSRDSDTVARIGGDEFVLLIVHPEGKVGVGQSAQRIIDEIKSTMQIEGHNINIGASIGIALYPEDAKTEDQLMKNSDLALYEGKEQGHGSFLFYQPEMIT